MTDVKKVEKTAESGGIRNVAPGDVPVAPGDVPVAIEKVVAEKAFSGMAPADVAMTGAALADKAGVVPPTMVLADKAGIVPFDPDVAPSVTTRDTSFAQAVATRPAAAAASMAPDGPDPEPVLRDPTVKSFAQVRLERELSGEAAATTQQAYPDNRTGLPPAVPSPKAKTEMERGAKVVSERQSDAVVLPKTTHKGEKVEKLERV